VESWVLGEEVKNSAFCHEKKEGKKVAHISLVDLLHVRSVLKYFLPVVINSTSIIKFNNYSLRNDSELGAGGSRL
jgi:hypothetical protein